MASKETQVFEAVDVKGGKCSVVDKVPANIEDGFYDVVIWSNGSVSFYAKGYAKEIGLKSTAITEIAEKTKTSKK